MLEQLLSPSAVADSSRIHSSRADRDLLPATAASQNVIRPKPQAARLGVVADRCGGNSKLCDAVLEKLAVVDTELLPTVTEEEASAQVGLSELQSFAGAEASVQVRLTWPVKLPTGVMRMVEEPLSPELAIVTAVDCS